MFAQTCGTEAACVLEWCGKEATTGYMMYNGLKHVKITKNIEIRTPWGLYWVFQLNV